MSGPSGRLEHSYAATSVSSPFGGYGGIGEPSATKVGGYGGMGDPSATRLPAFVEDGFGGYAGMGEPSATSVPAFIDGFGRVWGYGRPVGHERWRIWRYGRAISHQRAFDGGAFAG